MDISDVIKSSGKFGFYSGVSFAVLSFFWRIMTVFSNNFILNTLFIFCLFFIAGFVLSASFQILIELIGPLIDNLYYKLPIYIDTTRTALLASGLIAVLLSVGLTFGIYYGLTFQERSTKAQYSSHMSEYIVQPIGKMKSWDGHITGKVITIDIDSKTIDDLYLQLSESYQPTKPEEIGTVVWLKWGLQLRSNLSNGGSSYDQTCDVTIIDLSKNMILFQKSFVGEPPVVPSHGAPYSNFYGTKPVNAVISFIQSYPQVQKAP